MSSDQLNNAERLALRPVHWLPSALAIALMFSLALGATVRGVSATLAQYEAALVASEAQLATVLTAMNQGEKATLARVTGVVQESSQIIIKYKDGAKLPPGLSIAAERANLEQAQGLVKVLTINGINAEVYQVSDNDTAQEVVDRILITKGDLIEYAEVDMLMTPDLIPNDPLYASQWHHPKVATPLAWDSVQGEGVTVAILDTGVNPHPDLTWSTIPARNFYLGTSDVTDVYGHGTYVAGVSAAIGGNAVGVSGISPKSPVLPLKISADSGSASWSATANALTYAADNGVRVANISYSGANSSATIINAASYMRSKGGVVVTSAGNTGASSSVSSSDLITVVSATASNDARTSWSTYGNYVDVSAPGASIYTTTHIGGYTPDNGTSFSAPLVAGIYALIFAANPALTPTQADNILFSSVDDLGTVGWDIYYGHGRVNAGKAVAAALATVGVRDTVAPSVPANFRTTNLTSTSVSLAWNSSTDDNSGVAGYEIYRNGIKLTTVAGTSYVNSGLTANTAYTYTLRAVDGAGNVSAESSPLIVTTPDVAFGISGYSVAQKTNNSATIAVTLTKPGAVTLRYGTSQTNLNLSAASTANNTTNHSISLTGLSAGVTYYYQVVATDSTNTVPSAISSFKTSKGGGGGGGGPKR